MRQESNLRVNKVVFFPTIIALTLTVIYSLYDNDTFLKYVQFLNDWILENFGQFFSWGAFFFLIILLVVYISPLGKVKIGGTEAEPILTKWKWFAIALCTTVATGILFWGTAEPLYHLQGPPTELSIESGSRSAAVFGMSTMYMHWSFSPYGIYTITGLAFALAFYNHKQPFQIKALLYPLWGKFSNTKGIFVLDILSLYGLVAGMAASLGAGIFAITGGLENITGLEKSDWIVGLVGFTIVISFIVSAVSGLNKGISMLSNWNATAFFVLCGIVLVIGPTS